MFTNSYSILRRCLFALPPERAHAWALQVLKWYYTPKRVQAIRAALPQHPVTLAGLTLDNPIGLAAGFDKNGDYIDALFGLGFGFIEVGTVTPKPQPGNPEPRLFRLSAANALINRMGFNNSGVKHLVTQLRQRQVPGVIGVNIGKNKSTPLSQAAEDYVACLAQVYPYADYITINISSPNTPELRQLQGADYLPALLETLSTHRQELEKTQGRHVPLFVKLSADLDNTALATTVKIIMNSDIEGIIATNTSTDRVAVAHLPHAFEQGGLSGQPIFERSTRIIEQIAQLTQGRLPIIGVGGILSEADARAKFNAGATAVQVYTGLIYQGPHFIQSLLKDLAML